jgi:hypothetical protein
VAAVTFGFTEGLLGFVAGDLFLDRPVSRVGMLDDFSGPGARLVTGHLKQQISVPFQQDIRGSWGNAKARP